MAGRKVRDAAEAATMLEEAAASGTARAAWARAHGIDARSLNAWRLNLEGRRHEPPLRLVELVVAGTAPPERLMVVRCGPFSVELGEHFDDAVLRRVLAAVSSC